MGSKVISFIEFLQSKYQNKINLCMYVISDSQVIDSRLFNFSAKTEQ